MEEANLYREDMKKLVFILNEVLADDRYILLQESFEQENTLEYGTIGQKMEKVPFEHLNGESFGEFLYKGIYIAAPNSVIDFMNVRAFGNLHSTVVFNLNERVRAMILNRNHKYDNFIEHLRKIMENSENVYQEKHSLYLKK